MGNPVGCVLAVWGNSCFAARKRTLIEPGCEGDGSVMRGLSFEDEVYSFAIFLS